MITVIADDITGAAEIAGIAFSYGLQTRLAMSAASDVPPCDVLVVATDTRSLGCDEAVAETLKVINGLGLHGLLFKKTDSALRGHVVAELKAIMAKTKYRRAVYLPANPSKGRIIRAGTYYICGVPISETDFKFDPEFPALSSSLAERFPDMRPYHSGVGEGLFYADAETPADISRVVDEADADTLLAGAADLFECLIRKEFPDVAKRKQPFPNVDLSADIVIVRGSTLSKAIDLGIPVSAMPADVYNGVASTAQWQAEALRAYSGRHALILSFGQNHGLSGQQAAMRLRTQMSEVAIALVSAHRPKELIIEGGATAYSLLSRLGWHDYTLTDQIASGVVRMLSSQGTYVTLKPGSYPWGGLFG